MISHLFFAWSPASRADATLFRKLISWKYFLSRMEFRTAETQHDLYERAMARWATLHPTQDNKTKNLLAVLSQTTVAEHKTLPICVLAKRNPRSEMLHVHREQWTGLHMHALVAFTLCEHWTVSTSNCIWHIVRVDMQHYSGMTSMCGFSLLTVGFNWIERRLNYVVIDCGGHGAWARIVRTCQN